MNVAAVDTSSGQRDEGFDAKTQWLQTIQGNVKEAMKGKKGLYNWTDFINKVVLHFKDKSKHDNWIVASVAVLFDYGITEQPDLEVADRVVLKNHLERDRVPLIMADILFKYVASDQAAADTNEYEESSQPPPKKRKLELPAVPSDEQIFEFIKKCAHKNRIQNDPTDFCCPGMISETWKQEALNVEFRQKRQKVLDGVRNNSDSRALLVMTVVAGYGNGKTHFLQSAPEFVGQGSIYVTYNREQDLTTDTMATRKALLLRIIFGALGTGSFGAANFLTSKEGLKIVQELDNAKLLTIAAKCLEAKFASSTGFLICIDEVRKLEKLKTGATASLLSTVGALAVEVYKLPKKLLCTAVVSALDNDGIEIYTQGGRSVVPFKLPNVDQSAIDLVSGLEDLPEEHRWKVVAVAGSHFRSIVAAVDALKEGNMHVGIERLVNLSFVRLRQSLTPDSIVAIGDYITATLKEGLSAQFARPPLVESNCSIDGAIPPALICATYRENPTWQKLGAYKHALGIFHNDIENGAFDQLELSAMHFDLLRSIWELPVVPSSMTVIGGQRWHAKLKFQRGLQTSAEGILQMKNKTVVWTGLEPVVGVYYHPGLANHPWIDRFFMAETEEGKKCLVLYQDKISASGFPDAVGDLNLAAEILTEKLKVEVLCIANATGASGQTRSQSNFKYPHLLVRDSELDDFYTTNFAPAMRFLRARFSNHGVKTKPSNS